MNWYERNPERLAVELKLISQFHPRSQVVKQGGLLRIRRAIRGRMAIYSTEVIYPVDFPFGIATAIILAPKLRSSPHQFAEQRLCICHAEDVSLETTGKVYCDWVDQWIERYERFCESGDWND